MLFSDKYGNLVLKKYSRCLMFKNRYVSINIFLNLNKKSGINSNQFPKTIY